MAIGRRLDAELENVRAALAWFMDRGDHASVQRFAGSLGVYLMDRGLLTEMRSWLEKSLESESDSPGLCTPLLSVGCRRSTICRGTTRAHEPQPSDRSSKHVQSVIRPRSSCP